MKKGIRMIVSVACTILACGMFAIPTMAGKRTVTSTYMDGAGNINETEWNRTDERIVLQDGKLIFPRTSTWDTRFISKNSARIDPGISDMIRTTANFRFTTMPQDRKFILAFGLRGIEAYAGDEGNVEIHFENKGNIRVSVVCRTADGTVTLVDSKNCGISLNSQISFTGSISSQSVMSVNINGQKIYDGKLPISGEGRFGILQTGSCAAEFSELTTVCSFYDMPENTNIYEDFEDGEFNANEIVTSMLSSNGLPYNQRIEEYNGSKVFMFRNVSIAYFSTIHKYSDFELSFDVPYYLRQNKFDENGNRVEKPCRGIAIGFGGENGRATIETEYKQDVDLIEIGPDYAHSKLEGKFAMSIAGGLYNIVDAKSESGGFSVKLTMLDGHATFQMKPLNSSTWTTVAEVDYEDYRSGTVRIWVTDNASFAIDNFKITNKDKEPNLIDVDFQSNVMVVEDYELTEEEMEMVFREDVEDESVETEVQKDNSGKGIGDRLKPAWYITGGTVAIVLIAVILVFVKHKKQKGEA